ncbi:putative triacylglycerol lipase [Helianthus annuus]|uniref:Triacylglycerol lipase n=1 Tax=Helianthus annuus TaxID=4232 RepID=A0A9K3GW87_HELAN|nr:putative triacylglycerol lipase [Helianthus annuus]
MDLGSEVTVDAFSVGPPTVLCMTISFKFLFLKSMSHLRHHISYFLVYYFSRIRGYVSRTLVSVISCCIRSTRKGY